MQVNTKLSKTGLWLRWPQVPLWGKRTVSGRRNLFDTVSRASLRKLCISFCNQWGGLKAGTAGQGYCNLERNGRTETVRRCPRRGWQKLPCLSWGSSTTEGAPKVPVQNHLHVCNKQELLVLCVPLQIYDLTGTIETWWDCSHGLSAAMKGKKDWESEEMHFHRSDLNVWSFLWSRGWDSHY